MFWHVFSEGLGVVVEERYLPHWTRGGSDGSERRVLVGSGEHCVEECSGTGHMTLGVLLVTRNK